MNKLALQQEIQQIDRAKKDPRHFAPLYEAYHEQIFRFVYQRMSDKSMAADITQQVFIKALNNLHRYKHKGFPFGSWLYRIAANEVNGFYRNQNKERVFYAEMEEISYLFKDIAVEDNNYVEEPDKQRILISLLEGLDEIALSLIELRYFEKRSFKEIGEILGITENNAKVTTYRVIDRLKKKLDSLK